MPRNYTATELAILVIRNVHKIVEYHHHKPLLLFTEATCNRFHRAVFSLITAPSRRAAHRVDEEVTS